VKLYEKVTKKKCVMWGQIFGFGEYHYKYESGREGDSLASKEGKRKIEKEIKALNVELMMNGKVYKGSGSLKKGVTINL
jgi:hypothetical protein